jgi:ribosomal-protein-alanine N-acetyltransferase
VKAEVRIESARTLDLGACRRLILASEPWITLQYGERDVQAIARAAAKEHLLIARVGGEIVGFALSAPGILLGEYLKILVVDAAYQSRGIGRRLMQALERRAFRTWPNVYLCVSEFNAGARRFYRRLGYEEVGSLRDLVLPGAGEVLMRKTIAAWQRFREAPLAPDARPSTQRKRRNATRTPQAPSR